MQSLMAGSFGDELHDFLHEIAVVGQARYLVLTSEFASRSHPSMESAPGYSVKV